MNELMNVSGVVVAWPLHHHLQGIDAWNQQEVARPFKKFSE
jgi:hypothetical protein